jgi:hypothetical protein
MPKRLLMLTSAIAICSLGSAAQAGGWHHGPPCPDTHYWRLSPRAYAEWKDFGLFRGSWGERHKGVRRNHREGVVVKVWRPTARAYCRHS